MPKSPPASFWAFLLLFSAVSAPICNSLLSLKMPLLHPATLTIFLAITVAAGIFAATVVRVPRSIQGLLITAPSLAFIDVAYGGNNLADLWRASFQWMGIPPDSVRFMVICAAATGLFVIAFLLAANAVFVFSAIFSAILFSTLALQEKPDVEIVNFQQERVIAEAGNGRARDKPVVVILLFDELMSASAFPDAGIPDVAAALRKRILDFHDAHGFRIYTNAYSRHYWTRQAIPAMLNVDYERTSLSASYLKRNKTKQILRGKGLRNQVVANAIFDKFGTEGYAVEVFQSDIMYFCNHSAVTYCATLDSYNPVSRFAPDYSTGIQSLLILRTVFGATKDSYVVNTLQQKVMPLLDLPNTVPRIDVQSFVAWLAKIKSRILEAEPGTLIFAHILMPHAPHMLNDDCSINPQKFDNPYSMADRIEDPKELERMYRKGYRRYYRQLNCLYSELESLFESIELNSSLKDATFVITGDHGSRISKSRYAESMDTRDLLDNYAAHFSIKAPKPAPGIDRRKAPVQRILGESLAPSLVADGPVQEHTVMANVKGKPDLVKVEIVEFGSDMH